MLSINRNSILFLYEGATEIEFYKKIFQLYIPHRSIRIHTSNLEGVWSLNKKVKNKIFDYLINKSDEKNVNIVIAIDRDGNRNTDSRVNIELINKEIRTNNFSDRVSSISEIIATQDIESWFFKDIDGIFKFLRVTKSQRNPNKYRNAESFNNRDLSALFSRYDKHYQKGSRVEGFIDALDIEKIFNQTPELKSFIELVLTLI